MIDYYFFSTQSTENKASFFSSFHNSLYYGKHCNLINFILTQIPAIIEYNNQKNVFIARYNNPDNLTKIKEVYSYDEFAEKYSKYLCLI